MKYRVWKYSGYLTLAVLSVEGLGTLTGLPTPNTGALYLILATLATLSFMLLFQYLKARTLVEAIKDDLSHVLADSGTEYSYTRLDGCTLFYLDSEAVIRLIEQDRERLTADCLRRLQQVYRKSPRISSYFKLVVRVD